jgi:hypothetical protein
MNHFTLNQQVLENDMLAVFSEINRAFPQFTKDKGEAQDKLSMWTKYLSRRYTRETMFKALELYILEGRFAPAIADLYERCRRLASNGDRPGYKHKSDSQITPKAYVDQMVREGMVPCRFKRRDGTRIERYYPQAHCTAVNGKWVRKIDFIQLKLGASVVDAAFRELLDKELEPKDRRYDMSAVLALALPSKRKIRPKIEKLIDDLVKLAKEPRTI